jgi:phosphatidylserine/phosphatidylglycerophosphate/cardiolipin synthase-like enzyme
MPVCQDKISSAIRKRKRPDETGNRITLPVSKYARKSATNRCTLNFAAHLPADHSTPHLLLRGHVTALQALIRQFARPGAFVVGCVAWMTHPDLIDALSEARVAGALVQFIVNKETHLRNKKHWLRKRYDVLGMLTDAELASLNGLTVAELKARPKAHRQQGCVRCFGRSGGGKYQARMHHKFVVCGTVHATDSEGLQNGGLQAEVGAVGSFNWTKNATQSLESIVILHAPTDCEALVDEFRQIARASEPLHYLNKNPCQI